MSIMELSTFESGILLWIQENLRGAWDKIVVFITFLGDAGWFWIALTVLLLIIRKTRIRALGPAFALAIDVIVCNVTLKNLFMRPRPYVSFDFLVPLGHLDNETSFPSGHTCSSFAAAAAIYFMYGKKAGIPAFILASLISLSRLYVGVHYPTDILAGVIVGVLCGLAGAAICKAITKKVEKKKATEQK